YALAVYNSGDTFTTKLSEDNGYIVYTDGEEKILIGYNGAETDLTLPSYITKINQYAFYDCDSLTSVVIGDSVTSISEDAFYDCGNLMSVVIPESVTSIDYSAFDSCHTLKDVYYKGTAEDWTKISFISSNRILTIAMRYYYSESEPTEAGNYWRYVDGAPTKWE
ncbi:MAG: leucine-rich repeat domain-containing protein, partial [Clostridia bacterium]|nr:leucine-rich repeat domain-containing protein [Clostridia bacterium]